nr:glycosyltransferase 87 family protein [Rhodococcus yunnanensis]
MPLVCVVIVLAVVAGLAYNLVGLPGLRALGDYYRIDLDVYRLGGRVFVSGSPLYGQMPPTAIGNTLPFTYPPIAATIFGPLSMISLHWAGIVVTAVSLTLLFGTIVLTLVSLGVAPRTVLLWVAGAVFAVSMILEPVFSTFDYGQINIILMAFVAADCLPRKTPWPRGVLIGFVAAVKLTPAVFVLFFLFRKDFRAAVVSGISFAAFTALGFAVTFSDSLQYWTQTLVDSDRIGRPAYPANQSISGVLARLGLEDSIRSATWIAVSFGLLVLTFFAMRKAFAANQTALGLGVNAMFGLLVSPVSWSHHWVWVVPFMVALATLAYRRKNALVLCFVGIGAVLMHFAPHWGLAIGRSSGLDWPLWDQLAASSYVWWGIAAIVAVASVTWPTAREPGTPDLDAKSAPRSGAVVSP